MTIDRPLLDDIPALRALWREAFSDGDVFLNIFFESAFSLSRASVAREGREILGALYWFDCELWGEKYAYIYAVATTEKHRGKGVCAALMSATHEHLSALGYVGAILVPGEPSLFKFYEKMGYKTFGAVKKLTVRASDTPCKIEKIGKEEYAAFRRKYLPEGGVLQEGVNLDFLARIASLYRGEDFVLAAYAEGDILVGLELLGNSSPKRIGGIISSLGLSRGVVRTAGNDTPFAMCIMLGDVAEHLPKPKYFGLAFD